MWNKLIVLLWCEFFYEINELLNEIVNRIGGLYLIIIDLIVWYWWYVVLFVDYNLLLIENKINRYFFLMLLLWMYMYIYKNICICMKWRYKEWEFGLIFFFLEYEFII